MKIISLLLLIISLNFSVKAELIKADPSIDPKEVIQIQLNALKVNNSPFKDAGIAQTWEFAHPNNRKFTGPLENFTKMMYSDSYSVMLNHLENNIIMVSTEDNKSFYFVEILDKNYKKFGFTWVVEQVIEDPQFRDCWMTTSVSRPMPLSQST